MLSYVTVCDGEEYLDYAKALIASIDQAHKDDARLLVMCANISPARMDEMDEITKRVGFVRYATVAGVADKSKVDYAVAASHKMRAWVAAIDHLRDGLGDSIFLDVDTIVLRNPERFFAADFDIGFTYKDTEVQGFHWPLNSGVVLAKLNSRARGFLGIWRDRTDELIADSGKAAALRKLWGGEDQSSLGSMLGTRLREDYAAGLNVCGARLQGFRCSYLNEVSCAPITDALHIIHYKGKWRDVLAKRQWRPSRPKEKCLEMYELWWKYRNMWG